MSRYCRACAAAVADSRCPACGAALMAAHPEIDALTIAHLDCDAFFAAIEKRDDPSLAAKPVIVGGGKRGVVATACYVARAYGVRSAMPMFKALKACPEAVVVKPDHAKYRAEGLKVRAAMEALTPLVEPVSIDEAFMDLSGLEQLHAATPAQMLIKLQNQIYAETKLTVSVGLSFNKFLAKTASDLDKPKGFSVIGRAEALDFLGPRPVSSLPGVGPAGAKALARVGAQTIADLRRFGASVLAREFGDWGYRLHELAFARDNRPVDPHAERKSISAETTLSGDERDASALSDILWLLSEKVALRARAAGLAGRTITLKLKDAQFQSLTRRRQLSDPTVLAQRIYDAAEPLLAAEASGRRAFRLIGVGLSDFEDAALADKGDLIDARTPKRAAAEAAMAKAQAKFGRESLQNGRSFALKGAPREDED